MSEVRGSALLRESAPVAALAVLSVIACAGCGSRVSEEQGAPSSPFTDAAADDIADDVVDDAAVFDGTDVGESGPDAGPGWSGTPGECRAGGNLAVIDYAPAKTYRSPAGATATATSELNGSRVRVTLDESAVILQLHSRASGVTLAVGRYDEAVRAGFEKEGVPGLDHALFGGGCSALTGRFEIHEISWVEREPYAKKTPQRLTVTFELTCDDGRFRRGCLHYSIPS